ncbi:hypothetical protein OV079_16525 [Nannocystis pusilla]|uniref:Uncharacterized protein n=1 Tax=Nannocystis pusilla TaxID=889268 RepID=A0A9X3EV90_9BACT|nr:hypothetical protein [Nannocystis pusilla]MCY1007131.1 hypothetical protein [Nannocystis pusilla]
MPKTKSGTQPETQPEIYAILKREHEEVSELLHQLKEAKGNAAQSCSPRSSSSSCRTRAARSRPSIRGC